jgi:hypothetical protein
MQCRVAAEQPGIGPANRISDLGKRPRIFRQRRDRFGRMRGDVFDEGRGKRRMRKDRAADVDRRHRHVEKLPFVVGDRNRRFDDERMRNVADDGRDEDDRRGHCLSERAGRNSHDPEVLIVLDVIESRRNGLSRVNFRSVHRHKEIGQPKSQNSGLNRPIKNRTRCRDRNIRNVGYVAHAPGAFLSAARASSIA